MNKLVKLVKEFFYNKEGQHKDQLLLLLTPTKDVTPSKYISQLYLDGLIAVKKLMGTDTSEQFLEYLDYVVTPEYAKNDYAYHLIRGMCIGGNLNSSFVYELRPTERGWCVEVMSQKGEPIGKFNYTTTDDPHQYSLSVHEITTGLNPTFIQLEYERIHGPVFKYCRNSFSGRDAIDGFAHRRHQLQSMEYSNRTIHAHMWQPYASYAHQIPCDLCNPFDRDFDYDWVDARTKAEMAHSDQCQQNHHSVVHRTCGSSTETKTDQEPSAPSVASSDSSNSE